MKFGRKRDKLGSFAKVAERESVRISGNAGVEGRKEGQGRKCSYLHSWTDDWTGGGMDGLTDRLL